jgi:hypothetical protein
MLAALDDNVQNDDPPERLSEVPTNHTKFLTIQLFV